MTSDKHSEHSQTGLISVAGEDAGAFLSAQLTNDVGRLGPDRHFLAAWCDAKGRALMLARVVDAGDHYLLIVPTALVDSTIRRLRMFVLRARVTLADASDRYTFALAEGADLPPVNRTENQGARRLLGLPRDASRRPRALVMTSHDGPPSADAGSLDDDHWRCRQIDAGVPTVRPETQGLYVPQMLNLHWLAAIDFDKGCYPGQEVIARLHYRGRLTRRMFRFSWRGARPAPGSAVVDGDDTSQGTVVDAAPASDQGGRLLAVVRTQAALGALHINHNELELLDLPYATPD